MAVVRSTTARKEPRRSRWRYLRAAPNWEAQPATELQDQSGRAGSRPQTTSVLDPERPSEALSGASLPMAVIKSSPTAFQSIPIAYRSATAGGSVFAGGFNDPVKSKMRAMPSQVGLRNLVLTMTFRLMCLAFTAICSLSSPLRPSFCQYTILKRDAHPSQRRAP